MARTADLVEPARRYGRHGDRRIAAPLRRAGWRIAAPLRRAGWRIAAPLRRAGWRSRIEHIALDGPKVPTRRPRRHRLWLADGSCIRLRLERPKRVPRRSPDRRSRRRRINRLLAADGPTISSRTGPATPAGSGCCAWILGPDTVFGYGPGRRVPPEDPRRSGAIEVARRLESDHVVEVLADPGLPHGVPEPIRSDAGPEVVATVVEDRIAAVGAGTASIEKGRRFRVAVVARIPAGPDRRLCRRRDNDRGEAFDGKLRDELLDVEIVDARREATLLIGSRRHPTPGPGRTLPSATVRPTPRPAMNQPTPGPLGGGVRR